MGVRKCAYVNGVCVCACVYLDQREIKSAILELSEGSSFAAITRLSNIHHAVTACEKKINSTAGK